MPATKILVVDDSRAIRMAVQRILVAAGYEVVCAVDGNEAIERLSHEPDLMVLDINMPGMDGYGVCEQLESIGIDPSLMPVVFLTSNESHAMELLGQQFGAYLQKPVRSKELLSVVTQQLAARSNMTTS
jgi:CheY-like chemotaxis protein